MAAGMQSFGQCTLPGRPKRERRRVPSRKQLFPVPEPVAKFVDTWTKEENKALVEYVLFHGDPNVWHSHSKGSKFRQLAAEFVQQRSGASTKRTGEVYHKFYSLHVVCPKNSISACMLVAIYVRGKGLDPENVMMCTLSSQQC